MRLSAFYAAAAISMLALVASDMTPLIFLQD